MVTKAIYKGLRDFNKGTGLPTISTNLDSIRAYQFEVQFEGINAPAGLTDLTDLTLAAKQVSQIGMNVEDIVVDRVNDKVYYPGKATPEEITITFDNLYAGASIKDPVNALWEMFKNTYDPVTGEVTRNSKPGGAGTSFKAAKMTIMQLDNTMGAHSSVQCYGVWAKSWKTAEFNYSTNEFHTLEVTFRYDFMDHISSTSVP